MLHEKSSDAAVETEEREGLLEGSCDSGNEEVLRGDAIGQNKPTRRKFLNFFFFFEFFFLSVETIGLSEDSV